MFWYVLFLCAGILLLLHCGGRSAVWGAASIGFLIGIVLAFFKSGFDWWFVGKAVTIGTFVGTIAEWMPRLLYWLCSSSKKYHKDGLSAASAAFTDAYEVVETFTNHANECYASITSSADLDPYTEAELDAHTFAMDDLTVALHNLNATFSNLNPDDRIYALACDMCEKSCTLFKYAADAYSRAASCAMTAALKGNIQAVKDKFEVMLLETSASNADEADAVAAKAKSTDFKIKATAAANNFKVLEEKARIAETRAKEYLAIAETSSALVKAAKS